jgi:hypothetical protein
VYSPTAETDFGQSAGQPPNSGTGPQSVGWDETPLNREQQSSPSGSGTGRERTTGGATASAEIAGRPDENPATYAPGENLSTRPTEDNYPTGMTQKEREDPYSAHGEKERGDKAS